MVSLVSGDQADIGDDAYDVGLVPVSVWAPRPDNRYRMGQLSLTDEMLRVRQDGPVQTAADRDAATGVHGSGAPPFNPSDGEK